MRPLTSDDAAAVLALDAYAFVDDPTRLTPEQATANLDWDRTFAAEHSHRPGEFSGLYSSYDLRLRVPGSLAENTTRAVPVNGLTWVGVHPDVRRRGVLRAMIGHYLQQARERGDIIAGLHASEPGIYGRFGFAVASHDVSYTLGRGTTLTAPPHIAEVADSTQVTTCFDVDNEALAQRMRAVDLADATLGTIVLPPAVVAARFTDHPHIRIGKEPARALVARRDGVDVGFAVFSRSRTWGQTSAEGTATVRHLAASDTAALLALGRRLVDMDLMNTVKVGARGIDDPLLLWAGEVRSRSVAIGDALWLRPVDVGAMLAARGYAAALDVTLDISDTTCAWNSGTWRLVVDDDGNAICERTDAPADLCLDVDVIGEIYLGLRGVHALAEAGRLTVRTPEAVASMSRAFATGVSPIGGASF